MSRYRTRSRRRELWLWLGGGLLLTLTAVIVGWIAYSQLSREKPLDKATLCPATGPLGHVVLLVDKTDPLNFTQRQAFSVAMKDLVSTRVPEGYLLSIFVLGERFDQTAEPLIELCNPGSDAGKSEFSANLKRLRQQYEDRFVKPIQVTTAALVADEPAKASPIFEMLQLVGINGFRKHGVKGPRRLVVFSDMLHNTTQFSMYQGAADYISYDTTDYSKKTRADLKGVDVEIQYLMTAPKLQTRRNVMFWERYFEQAGARLTEVARLEG